MTESKKMLSFLMDTVPADAAVTVASEMKILESLGIVSDERALSAMRVGSLFVLPDTPATFRGLMNLLTGLIRMNPKFSEQHQGAMDKALADAGQIDDFTLTFGNFLPICQKLLESKEDREPSATP